MRKISHTSAVIAQQLKWMLKQSTLFVSPLSAQQCFRPPPFSLPSFYDNKNNHWVDQLRIGAALSNIAGVTLQ